ncbi:hypothetical protein GCM10010988_41880 [Cnuibacter physcomitrellae]|nr:hypothetical protein GCM10010988_41880 [Cnuibacter physcomitrellae]
MSMNDYWFNAVYSVTPTILVGLIFWFTMRAILKSDSRERKVYAKIKEQERAKLNASNDPSPSGRAEVDSQ